MDAIVFVDQLPGPRGLTDKVLKHLGIDEDMGWTRFEDLTCLNPKVIGVGSAAGFLWFRAVCYCNLYMTNGRIPDSILRIFIDEDQDYKGTPEALIERLVEARFFHRDGDTHYRIHNYLQYQFSKDVIMERKRKAAEKGSKGGQQRVTTARRNPDGTFKVD